MAFPRFTGALYLITYTEVLDDLAAGRKVATDDLIAAASVRNDALAWVDQGRAWTDLGALRLAQARDAGLRTPQGQAWLAEAVAAHRAGLLRDPAQPYAWTRLAQATYMAGGDPSSAMRMAIVAGSRDSALVHPRLELALSLWGRLDEPTRGMVRQQIVLAARYDAVRLAQLTRRQFALAYVLDALSGAPELRRRVEEAYRRL
ncbi:MAG: hypothetical protein HY057_10515 [Rhodospirillales bacterium]|nr:hypothetical protein [Rhodospirillales bacterium]